ncbi:hypothetical protein DMN91_011294 [Ooceraea biroi]|uniref:Uncharacterized protein n=1 Tax=Ooceraea biroi TaxID=2015173 RepID=A0A026WZ00_OOCBI|nr:uncharacterized protein LOC105274512 [Ooceraea biroi]EZA60369.1 hypothetical protein X777_13458 [Ooceraea biroi]RLU17225.1 hypothetical protein DMN91_011294 [Ooceraea biroi]
MLQHAELSLELKQNLESQWTVDDCVRLIVYRGDAIFDDVIVKLHSVTRYEKIGKDDRETEASGDSIKRTRKSVARPACLCARGLNSYLVSAYTATLSRSYVYRKSAMNLLREFRRTHDGSLNCVQIILVRLRMPKKQFLDPKWSERLMHIILERKEADEAMCWLSTMGGAFSALGEDFEHCAIMAGKISKKQFELALILDNPILVARCNLYCALSLIQRGHFAIPRHVIKQIHKFAVREKDVRLQNMCQGIWAKLQYSYKQYRRQKASVSFKTLHISPRKSET